MSLIKNTECIPLLYTPAVEDGPGDLSGVPLQEVCLVAAAVDELEGLPILLDERPPLRRVDLPAAVRAQFDPEKTGHLYSVTFIRDTL